MTTICIPLFIAIFSFALPMILGAIERIDTKYHSIMLIKMFRKENWCLFFLSNLIISAILIFVFVLNLHRTFYFGILNTVIDNSVVLLISVFSLSLVVSTLGVVLLVYQYNIPLELLNRLISQYKKSKKNNDLDLRLKSISQLLYYSINQIDEELSRSCLSFYFSEFIEYRKDKEGQAIIYPQELYDTAFEANELLCKRDRRTISLYSDGTIYDWFFDGFQSTILSEKTYSLLWRCLVRNIEYERDDFVASYWKKAHQYCSFFLEKITPQYDNSFNIVNKDEMEKRNNERKRFFEFHYVLGGLLLMRGRYSLIRELMDYSNTQPPRYHLVPEMLSEVIEWYMVISKENGLNPVYYEQYYPFPNVSGVKGNSIIQMWIKRYLAILMLRQYTLNEVFIYSDRLKTPNIPKDLYQQKTWQNILNELKVLVNKYLTDSNILSELGMAELGTEDWFSINQKEHPEQLIERYKNEINKKSEETKSSQEIDPEKRREFDKLSLNILKEAFDSYSILWNKTKITEDYKSILLHGRHELIEKEVFAIQQEIHYINSDRIVADIVARDFSINALGVFLMIKRDKYTVLDKELFTAINRLKLDKKNFIIISIGINMPYYRDFMRVSDLVEKNGQWSYRGIEIFETGYVHPAINQSLIILPKDDLPYLNHLEIETDTKSKFYLEEVDKQNHIYTSLIDLNIVEDLSKEIAETTGTYNLKSKVLVCIDHRTEIRYKISSQCIHLKVYNQFEDRGTTVSIDLIKNVWE